MPVHENNAFVANVNTSGTFQAWGAAVRAALTAVGLTLEATSINWASVSLPATSTYAGYEVWKFPDPVDASAPDVYIKLRYGRGQATNTPLLALSVGTGWTSGDAITGPGSDQEMVVSNTSSGDAGTRKLWAYGDGDGLVLAHAWDSSTVKMLIVVDRQRRPDTGVAETMPDWGAPGVGAVVWGRITATFTSRHLIVDPVANDYSLANGSAVPCVTPGLGTGVSLLTAGDEVRMFTWWLTSKQGGYATAMAMTYPLADVPGDTLLDVPHLGATRQYRTVGSSIPGMDAYNGQGAGVAILWEP